ncbi:MAG: hypothetical protein HRT88_10740 [Lentisphaeraceae bacterium]|nr:hypothetical protein [Lentisphaeraceae bacterium]
MALRNFLFVVNATTSNQEVTIGDAPSFTVEPSTTYTKSGIPTGDGDITTSIQGKPVIFKNIPGGTNSWSTIVFTENGYINIFPSAANQGAIPAPVTV